MIIITEKCRDKKVLNAVTSWVEQFEWIAITKWRVYESFLIQTYPLWSEMRKKLLRRNKNRIYPIFNRNIAPHKNISFSVHHRVKLEIDLRKDFFFLFVKCCVTLELIGCKYEKQLKCEMVLRVGRNSSCMSIM